jgi:hypothetical protein
MKRTAVHGPGAKAKPAPTSKYVHQRHATARKPKAAPAADDNSQSLPATPKATATTDSPKTITQDDYRKQCEALGDVARVEWYTSDEARTDQGGNSQVDGQPDPPQQETPGLGNG